MPNFQQWLNAWVKVNTKGSTTPAVGDGGGTNHRSGRSQHSKTSRGAASQSTTNSARSAEPPITSRGEKRGKYGTPATGSSQLKFIEQLASSNSNGSLDQTFATSSHPSLNGNPEHAAIQKISRKKHKRRLRRTNSFSDMLRREAKHRWSRSSSKHQSVERADYAGPVGAIGQTRHHSHNYHPGHQTRRAPAFFPSPPTLHHSFVESVGALDVAASELSVSPADTTTTQRRSNSHRHHHSGYNNRTDEDNSEYHRNPALVGVAEFFGTALREKQVLRTTSSTASRHQTHIARHGSDDEVPSYLHSHLLSSYEQEQLPPSSHRHNDNASASRSHHFHYNSTSSHAIPHTIETSNYFYPPLPSSQRNNSSITTSVNALARRQPQDADGGMVLAGVRLPFFSRATEQTKSDSEDDSTDSRPFGVGEPNCQGCRLAEVELQDTQDSLQYMRSMAIRKEYTCSQCDNHNDNLLTDNAGCKTTAPTVKSSSMQMAEVTARHKKQVEQLLKERNYWQRKMHIKLDKSANLSRNLNNESCFRLEESQALKDELDEVKTERDRMAVELEELRAALQVNKREREEHRRVQEKMAAYESEGLRQAGQAIAVRDDMIAKLTTRLGATLDTLTLEREQQRQRRQIIFPPRSSKGRNCYYQGSVQTSNPNSSYPDNGNADEEVTRLRAQLLESERRLHSIQCEAKQQEMALLFRCETLEKQLNDKSERKNASKETHPFSGMNGWDIH